MQIRKVGRNIIIPKGYWTTTYMRSSNYGKNGNNTTKRKQPKTK